MLTLWSQLCVDVPTVGLVCRAAWRPTPASDCPTLRVAQRSDDVPRRSFRWTGRVVVVSSGAAGATRSKCKHKYVDTQGRSCVSPATIDKPVFFLSICETSLSGQSDRPETPGDTPGGRAKIRHLAYIRRGLTYSERSESCKPLLNPL